MRRAENLIGIAVLLALVVGPLVLGLIGLHRARRASVGNVLVGARPWDWKLAIASAFLYALAFNLTFLIQELFLVIPKALTPGLRPILFHNNHTWSGENPLAKLFQGTGALAIFVTGLSCALLLKRTAGGSAAFKPCRACRRYRQPTQSNCVHVSRGDGTRIGGDPAHHSVPRTPQLGGGRRRAGGGHRGRDRLDASRGMGRQ